MSHPPLTPFAVTPPGYQRYRLLRGSLLIIEGVIGAGKTTLGHSLAAYLNQIGIPTRFYPEYVNPELLAQYIADMPRYAYTFQLFMLRVRCDTYREAQLFTATGGIALIDRSLPGDLAFAPMQYDNDN